MDRLWKHVRKTFVATLASLMLIMPAVSQAGDYASSVNETPSALAMSADLIFVRPVMAVTTVVSSVVWVVALPFSALGGNTKESFDVLVKTPAAVTFRRCLGCAKLNRRPDDWDESLTQ